MGNRKQPFGYKVVMGEIALHPQESKLVEHIFRQYLAGATFNSLVEELREQSIPYDEGKLWNKTWLPEFWKIAAIRESAAIHRSLLEKPWRKHWKSETQTDGSSQNRHTEASPPLQRTAINRAHGATGTGSAQQPDHIAGTAPASGNGAS